MCRRFSIKIFFPVVVKEGAVYAALLGTATYLAEKSIFHLTPLEKNIQNKALIALATLALAYFATTRLIAGPLLGRISLAFSAEKALKLCMNSFLPYMGYTIWQEGSLVEHLSKAAKNGHEKEIEALAKAGANINEKDGSGNTPLHFAVSTSYNSIFQLGKTVGLYLDEPLLKAVEALLNDGANINEKNVCGETPLQVAKKHGSQKTIDALVKAGAKVDVEDQLGETPPHLTAENGHEKTTSILGQRGWFGWIPFF